MTPALLATVHAAATWAMVGVIWFVQVVHYPLFARVGRAGFRTYEDLNTRRTTLVVGPLMAAEAASAIALAGLAGGPLTTAGLMLLGLIWLSTAAVQVPCHARLARGFDAAVVRRLCRTNWIRTLAWTARGAVAALLVEATAAG